MAQIYLSTAILKDMLQCFNKHMRNNRYLNGTLIGCILFVELTFIYGNFEKKTRLKISEIWYNE